MVGIQLYGHLPDIVVDAAETEAEGVVVVLHVVKVETSQVSGIDGGMAPEQKATASLVPLADDGCGSLHVGRHVPHVALAYAFQVAHPEEHAERLDDIGGGDGGEGYELGGGIGLVEPQPCRCLVVVAVGNQLFGGGIDAQEADGRLTDAERGAGGKSSALVVDGGEGDFPSFAGLHVGDGVACRSAGEGLGDGARGGSG